MTSPLRPFLHRATSSISYHPDGKDEMGPGRTERSRKYLLMIEYTEELVSSGLNEDANEHCLLVFLQPTAHQQLVHLLPLLHLPSPLGLTLHLTLPGLPRAKISDILWPSLFQSYFQPVPIPATSELFGGLPIVAKVQVRVDKLHARWWDSWKKDPTEGMISKWVDVKRQRSARPEEKETSERTRSHTMITESVPTPSLLDEIEFVIPQQRKALEMPDFHPEREPDLATCPSPPIPCFSAGVDTQVLDVPVGEQERTPLLSATSSRKSPPSPLQLPASHRSPSPSSPATQPLFRPSTPSPTLNPSKNALIPDPWPLQVFQPSPSSSYATSWGPPSPPPGWLDRLHEDDSIRTPDMGEREASSRPTSPGWLAEREAFYASLTVVEHDFTAWDVTPVPWIDFGRTPPQTPASGADAKVEDDEEHAISFAEYAVRPQETGLSPIYTEFGCLSFPQRGPNSGVIPNESKPIDLNEDPWSAVWPDFTVALPGAHQDLGSPLAGHNTNHIRASVSNDNDHVLVAPSAISPPPPEAVYTPIHTPQSSMEEEMIATPWQSVSALPVVLEEDVRAEMKGMRSPEPKMKVRRKPPPPPPSHPIPIPPRSILRELAIPSTTHNRVVSESTSSSELELRHPISPPSSHPRSQSRLMGLPMSPRDSFPASQASRPTLMPSASTKDQLVIAASTTDIAGNQLDFQASPLQGDPVYSHSAVNRDSTYSIASTTSSVPPKRPLKRLSQTLGFFSEGDVDSKSTNWTVLSLSPEAQHEGAESEIWELNSVLPPSTPSFFYPNIVVYPPFVPGSHRAVLIPVHKNVYPIIEIYAAVASPAPHESSEELPQTEPVTTVITLPLLPTVYPELENYPAPRKDICICLVANSYPQMMVYPPSPTLLKTPVDPNPILLIAFDYPDIAIYPSSEINQTLASSRPLARPDPIPIVLEPVFYPFFNIYPSTNPVESLPILLCAFTYPHLAVYPAKQLTNPQSGVSTNPKFDERPVFFAFEKHPSDLPILLTATQYPDLVVYPNVIPILLVKYEYPDVKVYPFSRLDTHPKSHFRSPSTSSIRTPVVKTPTSSNPSPVNLKSKTAPLPPPTNSLPPVPPPTGSTPSQSPSVMERSRRSTLVGPEHDQTVVLSPSRSPERGKVGKLSNTLMERWV
ncbi:hypothetical protein P7C73_g5569, partial [Tremellales sp. Uapishka_1]